MPEFKVKASFDVYIKATDIEDAKEKVLKLYGAETIESVKEMPPKYKVGDIFINPTNGILFKIGYNTDQGLLLFKVTQGINVVGVMGYKESVTIAEVLEAWGASPHNMLIPCPWETYWSMQVAPLLNKHGLNTNIRTPLDTLAKFSQYGLPDLAESVGVYL